MCALHQTQLSISHFTVIVRLAGFSKVMVTVSVRIRIIELDWYACTGTVRTPKSSQVKSMLLTDAGSSEPLCPYR